MIIRILAVALAISTMGMSKTQERRIQAYLDSSVKAQKADEPVRAYLYLREAIRLEQLWTNNTAGEDSAPNQQLAKFTADLLHREDGNLLKLLHAKAVPTKDKLNLLHLLEDDVIMNFNAPGKNDELLSGFDE